MNRANIQSKIFSVADSAAFNALALKIFQYQARENAVYRRFIQLLGQRPENVQQPEKIPFLPIELFKTEQVVTGAFEPELTFTSSGTTGQQTSRHLVRDAALYRESYFRGFQKFYGEPKDYCILALLPSYLEREGSSLVHMVQGLIEESHHLDSGFYLHDLQGLSQKLQKLESQNQRVLLIGVSYALLDLAEQFPQPLRNTIIMETGGMKGKRKEITREELHRALKNAFAVQSIHSEYGMTELLSQAYSIGGGRFECPPWIRVLVREQDDPLSFSTGKTGGINVIDLANIDSCAFIATSDLGRAYPDGSFEVLGRFDYSDVRGCNLMVG